MYLFVKDTNSEYVRVGVYCECRGTEFERPSHPND